MNSQVSGHRFCVRRALILFIVAYALVTVLASATTIAYAIVNHSPEPEELGVGLLESPAFVATVPFHVLIMLIVWPAFAFAYFGRRQREADQERRETLLLAVLWLFCAMLVDFVGFVLIKNPWSLTPHEFYIDYQPWISLIYLSIFISPWIRLALARRAKR
jgi:hypothetical protein